MEQVFVTSTWGLALITAVVGWLSRPRTDSSRGPESDGLTAGLRFPFSLIRSHLDSMQLDKIRKADRAVVLIASPSCGACQPLLRALPDLVERHPDTPLVLLLFGDPNVVESAKAEYQLNIPAFAYTSDLEKALDTHYLPTLYVTGADERITTKITPHSVDELASLLA